MSAIHYSLLAFVFVGFVAALAWLMDWITSGEPLDWEE